MYEKLTEVILHILPLFFYAHKIYVRTHVKSTLKFYTR